MAGEGLVGASSCDIPQANRTIHRAACGCHTVRSERDGSYRRRVPSQVGDFFSVDRIAEPQTCFPTYKSASAIGVERDTQHITKAAGNDALGLVLRRIPQDHFGMV